MGNATCFRLVDVTCLPSSCWAVNINRSVQQLPIVTTLVSCL